MVIGDLGVLPSIGIICVRAASQAAVVSYGMAVVETELP
jgi:hypothetical protein